MKQPPDTSHAQQWHDRLQDWLDGELTASESAFIEAHLAGCADCQQSMADFEQLDEALVGLTPPLRLTAAFDQSLFAQIDAIDDSKRIEARRKLEAEWQQQMHALSRNWRRTLAFVIPGVVAGIAIAFALMSWLDSSGLTNQLVAEGAAELGGKLGGNSVDLLRIGMTTVVGAALGMLVAPWLARLAD